MADLVTLGDLKNRILSQADMANSDFIEDFDTVPVVSPAVPVLSELTLMIQCSIQDLFDMMVSANEDYFISEATFNTVTGKRDYDLITDVVAPDFYKLVGLDFVNSSGRIYPLKRFLFKERMQLSNMTTGSNQGYNLFYRVMGDNIRIMPVPSAVFPLVLTYIPKPVLPVYNSDTYDFVQGWDTYVKLDVVVKCLLKEESDASMFIAERQRAEEQIKNMIMNRDSGDAERILNVWDYDTVGRKVSRGNNFPPEEA